MNVKFSIKLLVDGKNQITAVAADVKALSKELSDTEKAAENFKTKLADLANIGFSFSHVVDGLKQLTGVIGQYTQAAAVQGFKRSFILSNQNSICKILYHSF